MARRRHLERLNAALREQQRVQQGREAQPSAGITDSQSVKTTGWEAARLRRRQEDQRA
jgi:transposase